MKNYPEYIQNTLHAIIRNMAKHPEDFCRCPGKDFTRNRKLTFDKVVSLLVQMGAHALRDEMLDCFGSDHTPASVSALVQQRSKIRPKALEFLFHKFTDSCEIPRLFKGYRLLAVDGSDLQYTADPNDPLSYFSGVNGQKHYSMLHLNALYDLNSHLYLDAFIQKRREANENAALVHMTDHSRITGPVILIADRGYEAYNTLEHISRKGWKYAGVWERSPKTGRLHFHGIFYIPEGTMPGILYEKEDYNFNTRRRQVTIQNTYFNERFGRCDIEPINDRTEMGSAMTYIIKYIEKSGEKIVYSRGLPQYFKSDILDDDVVCPIGMEDQKLLLFDNFSCFEDGVYIGEVSPEVIKQMKKAN